MWKEEYKEFLEATKAELKTLIGRIVTIYSGLGHVVDQDSYTSVDVFEMVNEIAEKAEKAKCDLMEKREVELALKTSALIEAQKVIVKLRTKISELPKRTAGEI